MTIFLTGATGFIGRYVLSRLLSEGHRVVALVRPSGGSNLPVHPRLKIVYLELGLVDKSHFAGCEILIHLAAHGVGSGMNDWEGCFRVNVQESLRLWLLGVDSGVRRLVVCGSCFEYGRSGERYDSIPVDAPLEPTAAYHASKAAASMAALGLAADKQVEVIVARPFHVYGEGEDPQRFWPSLKRAALAGKNFEMSSGEQVRDFIEVGMVAEQFCSLAHTAVVQCGKPLVVNIGSGKPSRLVDFAQSWWMKWGATGQLLPGSLPLRSNEVMRYVPLIKS